MARDGSLGTTMGRLLSIYLRLAVLVAVGARVGVVQAAPPGATQTAAPFLSLTDNVGEPNDVGWCIDLEGHGDSITLAPTSPGGVGLVYKCAARRNGFARSSLFSRIYTFAIPKCFQYLYL